ncbi:hypothetical protein GBA52_012859 [Prunus armeniaca]|nr:hypothetical protein GBA52_012859 [Prunus armeniaca]
MANRRRLQVLTRHASALFSTNTTFQSLQTPPPLPIYQPLKTLTSKFPLIFTNPDPNWSQTRHFSSSRVGDVNEDNEHTVGDSEDDSVSGCGSKREYTAEEKEAEAAAIGYQVIGPLQKSDRVFKPYEPVFAVVQIGSHQFKVSNGDCIFTERLKFCEVNDKLILNKVLLLGSSSQTIIGRPLLPDAAVHAVVEEHALDAKVIIFKKKRRKNYRRTKGHRQELTKLRIVDVQGIEKPEVPEKPPKAPGKKPEKVAVAA